MSKKKKVHIDAKTGQFVSEEYAQANPDTTVRMTVKLEPKEKDDTNKK